MLIFGIFIVFLAVLVFLFVFGALLFERACGRRDIDFARRNEHNGGRGLSPTVLAQLEEGRAWFDCQVFEDLSLTSCDGLCLRGHLLSAKEDKGVILFFHGYHSAARRDFSIQAQALHKEGYHLLFVEQRANGDSEGRYSCFGIKERLDVRDWAQLAARRFPTLPIALFGLSMGGASVLMAANTELPPSVRALIADCPFTSPYEIIARTLRYRHKIYPYPVIYFMNLWSKLLAGFSFWALHVRETLRENSRPTLLIHGKDDRFVPTEMSIRAKEGNAASTELFLVSGARHGQAILFETNEYIDRLLLFLKNSFLS